MIFERAEEAADFVRRQAGVVPAVGIVLGSGLGPLADDVQNPVTVPYAEIPHFPRLTVQGHSGNLLLGTLSGCPVAVLQGRKHYYESGDARAMNAPVATLKALGCGVLLTSNASGAMQEGVNPGDLALLRDHINWASVSPLIGEAGLGDPFVDMVDAYDPGLRRLMQQAAGRTLPESVYTFLTGPQFETPAEIRAIRAVGGDLVGMSTVPEVIFARYLGLRVAALSVVTNRAAGLDGESLSHAHTQATAKRAEAEMRALVGRFLAILQESGFEP